MFSKKLVDCDDTNQETFLGMGYCNLWQVGAAMHKGSFISILTLHTRSVGD